MHTPYTAPAYDSTAFNCARCGAYAQQSWFKLVQQYENSNVLSDPKYSMCGHCRQLSFWYKRVLTDPDVAGAPNAHPLLPQDIAVDYNEARSVAGRSPRSAAALLRLSVQKLCNMLGDPENTIDQNIALLVSRGLPTEVQQALDIVRVIGNEQVHPGTLDLRDNPEIVVELFTLINFIVEDRIARPAAIKELYEKLPSTKRAGIEARDKKAHEASNG